MNHVAFVMVSTISNGVMDVKFHEFDSNEKLICSYHRNFLGTFSSNEDVYNFKMALK